ncbi:MAG TPA: peroxidase family protein [Gemmatimonadaceae bacterium]|nr:peroxidase family protein [Gemmatimonadaceae bacterium]
MRAVPVAVLPALLLVTSCKWVSDRTPDLVGCGEEVATGARPLADSRTNRFQGKVQEATAKCRGGNNAVAYRDVPWTDWGNYWATRDQTSKSIWNTKNDRGVNGSLIDLEYERVELIKFNLFDNSGTYRRYVTGQDGADGATIKTWPEMRLPASNPSYAAVGGAAPEQHCRGELIRFRTLSGICNDTRNPAMGSAGTLFARNVEFESTFPDKSQDPLARNRHGSRLALLSPDPQVISRRLFTRAQSDSAACNDGYGKPGYSKDANCDYKKAPFFNVLAAFWIQFMTHDWFSHLEEGHNAPQYMAVGCATKRVNGSDVPLSPADVAKLGCRPGDQIDRSFVADSSPAPTFSADGRTRMSRAPTVFRNNNTAWWDASMIYGYDDISRKRVKRDPADSAKLLMMVPPDAKTPGDRQGYLPILAATDPQLPDWAGQEAAAFPDNWTIGMSFYHNVFAREHNQFVDTFRKYAAEHPDDDSGLRDPARPHATVRYRDVTPDVLFELGRLVVAAEIAKIHTIEWTPQLLYDEPLYRGMNANWSGLVKKDTSIKVLLANVVNRLSKSNKASAANSWYSVLASGAGIVGLGAQKEGWDIGNEDDVNGGTNHFGSPFNFPEEFVSVYRLHSLVPDLLEYRDVEKPNSIQAKIPVIETFRGRATGFMHDRGLSNWALTMGRQRLGVLALQNTPRFMQNIRMDRLHSPTKQLDIAALDIIRDRERGVPRFNEFRRQYGLQTLTSFDDFIDHHLAKDSPEYGEQQTLVSTLREVYGQHKCDASKVITRAQLTAAGDSINDCLGHPNGSMVDNVEDLDTVVGWLAETTRPHGFAISETQFVVFILNASRRLYSDRFFTSSFRPEIYSTVGYKWVNDNGPEPRLEPHPINGHENQPVSPLKRVLLRTMPELATELGPVENAFDPWARDRGTYYSVAWTPRAGAETDESFPQPAVRGPGPSPVTPVSVVITALYVILLGWGAWVGLRQIYQGYYKPQDLLNPLFGNRQAITLFAFHILIVSLDLFVCGPLALHYKARTWYWGGRIALLMSSFPIAFYFNRNPQSFGKLIGYWVRFRNIFEISLHVLVAAVALNWFYYYGLLYWLVAYRYLDVGPRRLIQTMYNTPAKLKARPWAPILNWVVITSIYILAALAVFNQKVLFASPPDPARPDHVSGFFEVAFVVALNVGIAMLVWGMTRKYTGPGPAEALLPHDEVQLAGGAQAPAGAYPTPARDTRPVS